MIHGILSELNLEEEQRQAAYHEGCDIVVLAGAGCGKTTTLVARYLYLLACGLAPAEIVAITFTERAGQEMRVRIQRHLRHYLAGEPADQALWLERYMALDSAPIGTIHGFCARLLRAHPAEAGLDPDFAVLDESQAAGLAAEAIERALIWASQEEDGVPCFAALGGPSGLRDILGTLLSARLAVEEALKCCPDDIWSHWQAVARRWLVQVLHAPEWDAPLAVLAGAQPLIPGDALDGYRQSALVAMGEARRRSLAGDWDGALACLAGGLRKPGNVGSQKSWGDQAEAVRRALRSLCDLYRDRIARLTDHGDPALDRELAAIWPGLLRLFAQARQDYGDLKAQRQAVDFDDLECGALDLLARHPEVASYERSRIKAVLVDEFQDTNEHQRRLVEALLGARVGQARRLFVVGDVKQSIYRFRGADVTVFREVEREVVQVGGKTVALDRTYRAHAALVEVLNGLLAAVLGAGDDPAQPFRVPFASLRPVRLQPRGKVRSPFVELHLGLGATATEGRRVAAAALAERLQGLHRQEEIPWGAMACLFRASTNFSVYEEAFEQAGIPYVTVAGQGFYRRPEVRDLLNALQALANPRDDLALAGLLRSPAIGLADASLYHLRWDPEGRARGLWAALGGDLSPLEPAQQARARRAAEILAELVPQVGRQPVATVLKRYLDLTGYPAILRLAPGSERASRNVDKLLADAHRSQTMGLGDFLQYVQMLNETAAREGEAPAEAGDVVQLMTVHKAKGLEFDVVVLADAAHEGGNRTPAVLLHPEWGLLLRITRTADDGKSEGLVHALARPREEAMADAEERRLLYVAVTRAKEKLLVSGHAKSGAGGLTLQGWVGRLAEALGDEGLGRCEIPATGTSTTYACWEGKVACSLYAPAESVEAAPPPATSAGGEPEVSLAEALSPQLVAPIRPAGAELTSALPDRVWRVVPRAGRLRAPSWVVGKLVHLGLRLWRFPIDDGLDPFLRAAARGAGLTADRQIAAAVRQAKDLLRRFAASRWFAELAAGERHHEVPYAGPAPVEDEGRIDLLCRRPDGSWWLVDFKTDELHSEADLRARVEKYRAQVLRYGEAVLALLHEEPRLFLCFLDYRDRVEVHEMGGQSSG